MTTGPSTRLATAAAVVGGAVDAGGRVVDLVGAVVVVARAVVEVDDDVEGAEVAAPAAVGAGEVL
jgi:hypothetical protein